MNDGILATFRRFLESDKFQNATRSAVRNRKSKSKIAN